MSAITPEIAAWLAAESANTRSDFIFDMHMKVAQGQALTPNMEAAIIRSFEKSKTFAADKAAREAKLAEAPALEAGRRPLSGKVVSAKFKESQFGTQAKMLVELADGNRVWGTVPASLLVDGYALPERGTEVAFTATVEVSADDNHFGFYSRPKVTA